MKYLVLLSVILIAACTSTSDRLKEAESLYKLALENKDPSLARVALCQIMLIDSNIPAYQDSLARLYIASSNFETGLRYAEKVCKNGPCENILKENMAAAYQQLGKNDEAEKIIKGLIADSKDNKYLFQQLLIYFNAGKTTSFDSLSSAMLQQIEIDSTMAKTIVPIVAPSSGGDQMVPIKAAVYFLIGNNALNTTRDINKGVEYMQLSLKEFAPFEMPRYVLQQVEQLMAQQGR
ncbi:MAG TPA: hypothetical protein DD396_02715 [Bacteroidetes bacterium]|jgi:tetratricopeptide (TPR) repeat protein|nr:hypothetical protein [Bacteroidota bacterium]